jgi:hypothetical protein
MNWKSWTARALQEQQQQQQQNLQQFGSGIGKLRTSKESQTQQLCR